MRTRPANTGNREVGDWFTVMCCFFERLHVLQILVCKCVLTPSAKYVQAQCEQTTDCVTTAHCRGLGFKVRPSHACAYISFQTLLLALHRSQNLTDTISCTLCCLQHAVLFAFSSLLVSDRTLQPIRGAGCRLSLGTGLHHNSSCCYHLPCKPAAPAALTRHITHSSQAEWSLA
jgi:hypothetical protein